MEHHLPWVITSSHTAGIMAHLRDHHQVSMALPHQDLHRDSTARLLQANMEHLQAHTADTSKLPQDRLRRPAQATSLAR